MLSRSCPSKIAGILFHRSLYSAPVSGDRGTGPIVRFGHVLLLEKRFVLAIPDSPPWVCVCHPLICFMCIGSKEQLLRCYMCFPCWSGSAGTGPFRPRRGIWNIGALKYRPMDCWEHLASIVDENTGCNSTLVAKYFVRSWGITRISSIAQIVNAYPHNKTQKYLYESISTATSARYTRCILRTAFVTSRRSLLSNRADQTLVSNIGCVTQDPEDWSSRLIQDNNGLRFLLLLLV